MNKRKRRFNRKTKHCVPAQMEMKLYHRQPQWMLDCLAKYAANDNNADADKQQHLNSSTEEPGLKPG